MTTPTLTATELLKFAQIQLAAEALYGYDANKNGQPPGDPTKIVGNDPFSPEMLEDGNRHASKFNKLDAQSFSNEWAVIDHLPNTKSGFSGTLLKNNKTLEFVISFRSTEFIDDYARDNVATNQLEIKDNGWALGQIDDMETWFQTVKSQITGPLSVTGLKRPGFRGGQLV